MRTIKTRYWLIISETWRLSRPEEGLRPQLLTPVQAFHYLVLSEHVQRAHAILLGLRRKSRRHITGNGLHAIL